MSKKKKKFTAGLEFLLTGEGETLPSDSPLLVDTTVVEEKSNSKKTQTTTKSRKSGKNFLMDLESVFSESLQFELKKRKENSESKSAPNLKRKVRPGDRGIDNLLKQTLENASVELGYNKNKRVTLVVDKENLDRLKAIAKTEKSYLRDLVGKIFSDFLDEYDNKQFTT